ncbi:hypothetical protein Clacol_008182 [Clathrus columnatus]|uniref:Mitochondrial dicarboxylate carrier n=1 Tax=Clathrus columnatus TaxID=1419009 RepID=A0AAV5AM35_9AGAM|nr:hypothetical protein Clacol_008182 [Clathrus columnatus]
MSSSKTPFWLGGVAGSMAACFTHPLDLTKLRMQTIKTLDGRKPSMFRVIRETIVSSGVRSLYVGLSASLLRQMTYSLVRLGSYDSIKNRITDGKQLSNHRKQPSNTQLLLAAGISGGFGGVAGNPADILLVRMTTDPLKPPNTRYNYSNAFYGLFRLAREEGFQGLLRGLSPNTIRAVLMNTSQLASLAGTIATTICSPADVIKARIMASTDQSSIIGTLAKSFREEGPMFIFKGWTPAFIRLAPNTVLMLVFLEQLRNGWRYYTKALP